MFWRVAALMLRSRARVPHVGEPEAMGHRSSCPRLECMCNEQHLADAAAALVSPRCLPAIRNSRKAQHNSHCARRVRLCPLAHLLIR